MATLLSALGLMLPAAAPGAADPGAPKTFRDGQFKGDGNGRKRADEDARLRGRRLLEEERAKQKEPKGKGPQPGKIEQKIDKIAEDALDKAGEKLRGIATAGNEFDELLYDDTPAEALAKDIENGIKSATEQIKYIQKLIDHAQKFGDATALAPISGAAATMKKISSGTLSGLKSAGQVVKTAGEVISFYESLSRFADASRKMSAGDGASVQEWVNALKLVWNRSGPFIEKFKDEAFSAALAGSEAAAALGATMAVVGAQLFIGLRTLDEGVKNVNAYFARLHEATREDRDRVVQVPPLPDAPLPFMTREEMKQSHRQNVAREKDLAERRRKNEEEARQQASDEAGEEQFQTEVFPAIYSREVRPSLYKLLADGWRKSRGGSSDIAVWWDCLIDDRPVDDAPGDMYEDEQPEPPPRAARVSSEDAASEVRRFLDADPPCPAFQRAYAASLAAWRKKQAKAR